MITFTAYGSLSCTTCGNTPAGSGFDPCTITGEIDYDLLNADSKHSVYYMCNRCGLVGAPE
jgi:predicted nucleic-acid-binding Zn-ribbon protein